MNDIPAATQLIAYCGLYCGACIRYIREECGDCFHLENAFWCTVQACCREHNYSTCADCQLIDSITNCEKLIGTSAVNVRCPDFKPLVRNAHEKALS